MWHSRMFWRLFGIYGGLLLGAIAVLGTVVALRMQRHYQDQLQETLQTRVHLVAESVRDLPQAQLPALQERMSSLGQKINTRITLIDRKGRVLADSENDPAGMDNHLQRPEIQAARETGLGTATRPSDTSKKAMQYAALHVEDERAAVAYVRVALPVPLIQQELAWFAQAIWTVAGVTALAAMALAFWITRRIMRPVEELTQSAERVATGDYGQKVYVSGRDEVGTLARTFNHMSGRLAAQFAQLESDREQLRTILSGMVEGVIALDAGQRILFANERAAELLRFQMESAVGRKLWEVVRQRGLQEIVRRALEQPEPCSGEVTWDGGTVRNLTIHAASLQAPPGRGAVLVLHDTTELRRLERLRQDFVANVSHELKTPLSVIKVCSETLLDGAVDDAEHRGSFLEQIAEQADRLHALILDLLSLARIESGEEVFEFEEVPLEPLVRHCIERHRARAESLNQTLEAEPRPLLLTAAQVTAAAPEPAVATAPRHDDPSPLAPHPSPLTPVTAWADEDALTHIVDNLVDNALKYTPRGGRISLRWWAEDDNVQLEVEDTGIGIPEQDLPRIFERFYRVHKARSRELGGTGLGLSIVKHLVQAMQGSIQATSRLGQGTTFRVQLRRARGS
jgi:two-component system, OmpR family, phosphate regulon sensor histidine kinase PhoR